MQRLKSCLRFSLPSANQNVLGFTPLRMRHSMTNLYETLGVHYDSTPEEIESAFQKLTKFFDPA